MKTLSILIIILFLIICFIIIWAIISYNKFIKGRNDVDEAFATMDVYLKKRFDLIPSLVATIRGYVKHEQETLTKVLELRNNVKQSFDTTRFESESALSNGISKLFAVAENYPNLKANANFIDLQEQLSEIELEISNSRRFYNAVVKKYNTSLEIFPSAIIANIFNFEHKTLYEVETEKEREAVQIKF